MHPRRRLCRPCRPGFPRTRGDAPPAQQAALARSGLPPHTRGCTGVGAPLPRRQGASPAHAGMHPRAASRSPTTARFPRTRGDAPKSSASGRGCTWLPPHTRGCTVWPDNCSHGFVASPAHAGMHLDRSQTHHYVDRFPRTRGDAPDSPHEYQRRWELPPHTRGCTLDGRSLIPLTLASPAHAGMHRTRRTSAS